MGGIGYSLMALFTDYCSVNTHVAELTKDAFYVHVLVNIAF